MNIDQQNKAWNVLSKRARKCCGEIFRFQQADARVLKNLLEYLFGGHNLKTNPLFDQGQELLTANKKEILTLCQDNRDNIIGSTLRNIFGDQLEDNDSHDEETTSVQEDIQSLKEEITNKIPSTEVDAAAAKFWAPEVGQKVRLVSDPSIVDTVKNIYDAKSPAGTLIELSDGSLLWSSGVQPYVRPLFKLQELVIAPHEKNEVYTISSIRYNGQDQAYYYEVYELEMASFKESQLEAYPAGLDAPKFCQGQKIIIKGENPCEEGAHPREITNIYVWNNVWNYPAIFYMIRNKDEQAVSIYHEDDIKLYVKPLTPGDEVPIDERFLKVDKVWHQENVGILFTVHDDPHVYNEAGLKKFNDC